MSRLAFATIAAADQRLARSAHTAVAALNHNCVPGRTPEEPPLFLRAGGGYSEPWTRDAAINAWTAGSWLIPEVAADTLRMVCDHSPEGDLIAQDDQWWDQVLWVIAAWRHYLLTGDQAFLSWSYDVAQRSVALLHRDRFDATLGLYRGPAMMQDGISGYPESVVDPGNTSSFVLDHPTSHIMVSLSTNLAYAAGYESLAAMAEELGLDAQLARQRATGVREAIRQHLRTDRGWAYLLIPTENGPILEPAEETLGWALAILSGFATPQEAQTLVAQIHREPYGVVSVWPHFQDFGPEHPGRHNVICWPMIMGLWAQAVAMVDLAAFQTDLHHFLKLIAGSDDEFFEVYNARTGAVDGGWQVGRSWASEPHQTWSATGLLGVILHSVLGLHPSPQGLRFAPHLPEGIGPITMEGIRYGQAVLNITVTGKGSNLGAITIDGVPVDIASAVHLPVATRDLAEQDSPVDVHIHLA